MQRNTGFKITLWMACTFCQAMPSPAQIAAFDTVTLSPALQLNGAGTNVDSVAFWEAPNPGDTLLFVTGKDSDSTEVWKYPFANNELPAITFPANVNGVAVDQETDLLYVSDRIVSVFSLPGRQLLRTFGQGIVGVGENNLGILKHTNGQTWIYVSDDHKVHRFVAPGSEYLGSFAPPVSSIETIVADNFYQVILVPEEQGPEGNPGIYAYHPDGAPFNKNGTNRFGNDGEFDSDEEGILLYSFPANGSTDNGTGFYVVSDQDSPLTEFEFFDRQTWAHLGKIRLQGVSETDGIASTQRALPGYPLGVFAAQNNDLTTAVIGWDAVFAAIGWNLAPEAVSVTPVTTGPTDADTVDFTVVFSEPVTGFNDSADLSIIHQGTASTAATITGSGATYTVSVSGISGAGLFTIEVSTAGDVRDLSGKAFSAGVRSAPVLTGTSWHAWAVASALTIGVNGGAGDDPDNDGRSNIEEFATNSDPLSGTDAGRTRTTLEEAGGETYLTYTFPARNGAVFTGAAGLSATVDRIAYTLSGSLNLLDFSEQLVEVSPALQTGLPALEAGWSYRTIRMSAPGLDPSAGFLRLLIAPAVP